MEEEHVADEAETDDLRRRGEETLQTAGDDEGDVIGGKGGEKSHPERQKHGPPKDGDTTEPLGERDCDKASNPKHLSLVVIIIELYKYVAGQRAANIIGRGGPIERLCDNQGSTPRRTHVRNYSTERDYE